MKDLIIYSTPPEATVELALDDGRLVASVPATIDGRADGHRLTLPEHATAQGGILRIKAEGWQPFENRGIPSLPSERPADEPFFLLDDVRLAPAPVTAPEPPPGGGPPPVSHDPATIINNVYATGQFNLATHDGCGQFTEACCDALRAQHSTMWGHILKQPGQNQYQGHAVDALMLLAGADNGIWDIIISSVSYDAKPAYNYVGPPDPALWYYPTSEGTSLVARPTASVLAAQHVSPTQHS